MTDYAESAEKSLRLAYWNLKKILSLPSVQQSSEECCDFLAALKGFKVRLFQECAPHSNTSNRIDKMFQLAREGKWPSISEILNELTATYFPLDLHLLQELIQATFDKISLIADRKICLLVGPTGTGKSSTICWLGGQEMRREMTPHGMHYFAHPTARSTPNDKVLESVKMSPLKNSETRFINPVPIEFTLKYGARMDKRWMNFCGSAGFGDTGGKTAGQITLLSRTFGRGTDFACFDSEVLAKGGVLVIQTFLSLELSEEIQIRGRCGRQGQPGIYRLVLRSNQLERCGVTRAEVEEMKKTNIPDYSVLNEARIRKFSERYATDKQALIGATAIHQESMLFLKSLDSFSTDPLSPDNIRKYLLQQNMSTAVFKPSVTRTLVLMDATGSMGSYLHQAKQAVGDMFSRAREILRDHHRDVDCFMIQFAVYRNYNAPLDALFEHSPWTADPNVLRAFMDRMKPAYGISNEAVEVGLAHALEQAAQKDDGGLFQVILIGDVPSNNVTDVGRYLTTYRPSWGPNPSGKANWKFVQTPIDHLECLQKLKDQSIPVRAFYVNDYAKTAFMKYATMTAGECHKLSISGPDPAGPLTEAVTCAILHASAGGDVVVANQMTEEYRRRYGRAFIQ